MRKVFLAQGYHPLGGMGGPRVTGRGSRRRIESMREGSRTKYLFEVPLEKGVAIVMRKEVRLT